MKTRFIFLLMGLLGLGVVAQAKNPQFLVVENPEGTLFSSMGLVGVDKERAMEFLKGGASVNIQDTRGYTPLHYAVMFREWDLVGELAKKGARLSDVFVAAGIGDVGQMIGFLREMENINEGDFFKNTALHWSAMSGQEETADALIQRGAKVDPVNDQGRTPLMIAVLGAKQPVVAVLLKAGAKVKAMDAQGNTPLHFAIIGGQADVVASLLKKGADPNVVNARQQTAATMGKLSPNMDIQKLFSGKMEEKKVEKKAEKKVEKGKAPAKGKTKSK